MHFYPGITDEQLAHDSEKVGGTPQYTVDILNPYNSMGNIRETPKLETHIHCTAEQVNALVEKYGKDRVYRPTLNRYSLEQFSEMVENAGGSLD